MLLRLAVFVALLGIGWVMMNPSNEEESLKLSKPVEQWRDSGKFFQFQDKIEIFYRDDAGSSDATEDTVFLIHGFPTSSWDWVKISPFLRKRFKRVISYDMLGFGFSDKPDWFNYTIHAQADVAEALLKHLNVENYHLLTHDFGDTVGQEIVARYRERNAENRITSWMALNGGLFPELHRPRLIQKLLLNEWTGKLVQRFLSLSSFKRSFGEIFGPISQPTEEEYKDFYALVLLKGGKNINYKLIHYITDRQKHGERWVSALLETNIPTLFINGPFDPVSGQHMLDMYRQRATRPNHHSIALAAQVGHYPQLEAPMEVISGYFGFLDSLSPQKVDN